jgi:hypothetical protein
MHVCLSENSLIHNETLYLGGMVFIAIPFISYDGPPETDGKENRPYFLII